MAAVATCSRRLAAWRSPAVFAAAAALPVRPRPGSAPWAASAPSLHDRVVLGAAAARAAAAAPFSTAAAAPRMAKAVVHQRAGKKTYRASKKKVTRTGRSPLPGERKAFRKRIVLSNNNALAVPGLAELTAGDLTGTGLTAETETAAVPRILALPDAVVDQLRAVEAFKATQSFPLFRRPSLLVRRETVALATQMADAAAARQTLRLVIDGERLAGKSTLLQQALVHGFLNGWLVVHIPEAQELTTACTEYAALPGTAPVQWVQPVYLLRLLQSTAAANSAVLQRFHTTRAYPRLQHPVAAGSTLLQLVAAAREPDHAWPVFQALLAELRADVAGAPRPPVLFALDGLAHAMRLSDYRAPSFDRIHAHDLVLVRAFVDALAGVAGAGDQENENDEAAAPPPLFPHGGAVLAATSRGNAPRSPSMTLALAQRTAEQQQQRAAAAAATTGDEAAAAAAAAAAVPIPRPEPYLRGYDARVEAALATVRVLALPGVSKTEARALMEYWAASGALRERVDEQAVAGTWTLAGNGLVGEMERAALLNLRP